MTILAAVPLLTVTTPARIERRRLVGRADDETAQTLDAVREMVAARTIDPAVRRAALSIVETVPERDAVAQIAALRGWLMTHIGYIPDPIGEEYIQDPILLLRNVAAAGTAWGDCDDVATLAAALGQSIGLPARLQVVAYGSDRAAMSHIWTELSPDGGETWRDLDTTARLTDNEASAGAMEARRWTVGLPGGEGLMIGHGISGFGALGQTAPPPGGSTPGLSEQIKQGLLQEALDFLAGLFNQHPKDEERYQRNFEAYRDALNGDCDALCFLKQRSGRYGVAECPNDERYGVSGAIGGWATLATQRDAYNKYLSAATALASLGLCNVQAPTMPATPSEQPTFDEVQAKVSLMMVNAPIGADGLRWIEQGYITPAQVQAAYALHGPALYASGGALDPSQGAPVTVGPIGITTPMLIAGGAALVFLLALPKKRRNGHNGA